jgi:hypothetical protein
LIQKGEQSGLLTRTGTMEGASLCMPDEKPSAFVELESQVLTVTFYLESIQNDPCR